MAICKICGKEFTPYNKIQKYCSPECRRQRELEAHKLKYSLRPKIKKTIKTCAFCGKKFIPRNRCQKFCSPECRDQKHSNDLKTYRIENQITKICAICGKEFKTSRLSKKYCSAECHRKSKLKCLSTKQHYEPKNFKTNTTGKKTFDDWSREAVELHMDYGTYRAQVEVFGKTFEELKFHHV